MAAEIPPLPKITWIFLFIMLYWAYCIVRGVQGARRARKATDYFLAGRRLSPWLYILATTATCFSAWTFIGHPGLTYLDGFPYAYASFYAILIPFAGLLFLKRQWLIGRQFGFVTPGEMLAYYFQSDLLRLLVVLVALLFAVPYVGLQLRASGFLFNVLTDGLVGVEFGMWVLASVLVSYVASGGLWTVAWAGAFQAVLLTVGLAVITLVTVWQIGGWERLLGGIATLSQADPVRTADGYSHYLAVPGVIQWVSDGSQAEGGSWTGVRIFTSLLALMGIQAAPAFTFWAFANKDANAFAPQQVWASAGIIGFLLIVGTAIQGLGGHLLGADQGFLQTHPGAVKPLLTPALAGQDILVTPGRQDILVPQIINLLGDSAPWLVGLLAVCALAAMESTASCYMATTGSLLTRDLFKRFLLPNADDHTQKFIGRSSVLLVVVLALVVATTNTRALVMMGDLAVSYGLQMWPALIGICYWPWLTRQGVTLGLLTGLIVVTLTDTVGVTGFGIRRWGPSPWTIDAAAWGLGCNLGVTLLVSRLTRDDPVPKRRFHELLRTQAAVAPHRRRWIVAAWLLTLGWALLFMGPGTVIGNTLFGDPNRPDSWWFGLPSIWTWQLLGWALGVGLMGFLAYYLGLSRAPVTTAPPATTAVASGETA